MAAEGFAVLRYDPPGVGQSTGGGVVSSFETRVEETIAAIRYMQSLSDIAPDDVGLQGWSQGPWIMALTAARYPEDVAFLVSVVGSGQSVANQQIYGIEAQSRAAGLPEDDITKAVLFGRLLIDWQLIDPIFREANEAEAQELGYGPWTDFMELVYEPGDIGTVEGLGIGVEILKSVEGEAWAEALYLELQIPIFASIPADIPAEQLAALAAISADNLLTDPKDFLTEVRAPVLAFFGEDDLNIDSDTSPALFEQYLTEAGNEDFTIVVIPGVGHGINTSTPGYWDTLSDWLGHRYAD
jgi:pimeloyl-ACP methyl ester carboxylesterase